MTGRDLVLRNAATLTLEGPEGLVPRPLDIRIHGDRIDEIGAQLDARDGDDDFDATGLIAIPGFVQGHVHYCQTLFRGLADDLPLMPWLQDRIWPLEAAHDADSTRVSAELSVAELLRGGTTTAQVMESVHHAEESLAVAAVSGITTILGNCLMDVAGTGVPANWVTTTQGALDLSHELHGWIRQLDAPIHYAVSPRFILSCTEELSQAAAAFAKEAGLRIHTHACEHPAEVELVRERSGEDYILALQRQGLLTVRTTLAHCVHTSDAERDALEETGAAVAHCPTTNLKLGSGLAPIADYRRRGIPVTLGADGAACNNRLSALTELRQAALLAAVQAGPGTITAGQTLHAATLGGAIALGLGDEVGSLTPGKRADVVMFAPTSPAMRPDGDAVSRIVFAAETADIAHVLAGGTWRVRDGALTGLDQGRIAAEAARLLPDLLSRAGLAR